MGTTGYEVIPASDPMAWDNRLSGLPADQHDIHFTARYHRLYEANGDGQARLFCYRDGSRLFLYPFLLRPVPDGLVDGRWFDITSAYGYTGPACSSADPAFLAAADSAFRQYCQSESIVTEFVRFHPLLGNERYFAAAADMEVIRLRDYVVVPIAADPEVQFAGYAARNRTSIRKALKEGVRIDAGNGFDRFVGLYLENMRHLKADPLYFFSSSFFERLEQVVAKDGFLLVATHGEESVGAALFLTSGDYGHYFLASTNSTGRSLAAGNLLLHEGINRCRERGVRLLHLGGGLTGTSDDPLLLFKKSFSAQEVPYHIGRRVHRQDVYAALVRNWSARFPELGARYPNLLQRYRLTAGNH